MFYFCQTVHLCECLHLGGTCRVWWMWRMRRHALESSQPVVCLHSAKGMNCTGTNWNNELASRSASSVDQYSYTSMSLNPDFANVLYCIQWRSSNTWSRREVLYVRPETFCFGFTMARRVTIKYIGILWSIA